MTQQEEIQFIQSIIDEAPLSRGKREKADRCLQGVLAKYSNKIREQQQQLEKLKDNDGSGKAAKDSRKVPAKN